MGIGNHELYFLKYLSRKISFKSVATIGRQLLVTQPDEIKKIVNTNQNYHERYFYNLFNSFGLISSGELIGETEVSFFNQKGEIKKIYIFSKQHEHHYQTAYKMFKDKIIFGHGAKSFRVKCKEEKYKISDLSCATHPHNILMQYLSELGLIGFTFLFTFHILFIHTSYNYIMSIMSN